MCIFCKDNPKIVGKFFGYPECCINEFIENAKKYGRGDVEHLTVYQLQFRSGFMPCSKCAENIIKNDIKPSKFFKDRICAQPYPIGLEDAKAIKQYKQWKRK